MGCPSLYLAGADAALRVAAESGVRPLNWLLSAGRYWSGGRFRRGRDFETARSLGGLVFLDSGAQQFYAKFRDRYPYTPAQYLDFAVNAVGADLIATLDLPLDILTPRGLPVAEGIRKTVKVGRKKGVFIPLTSWQCSSRWLLLCQPLQPVS